MNAQAINKAAEEGNPKTNTTKAGTDQEKAINQLRQEIKTISKTVKLVFNISWGTLFREPA